MSKAQKKMFVVDGAHQLQAKWNSRRSEAARNRHGGNGGKVGGPVVAQQKSASGMILFNDARFFFADQRGGNGSGRKRKSVYAGIRESQMELVDKLFAQFESL